MFMVFYMIHSANTSWVLNDCNRHGPRVQRNSTLPSRMMRPRSFPGGNSEEVTSRTLFSDIKFLNEGCPVGTIPIMRARIMKDSQLGTSSSTSMDSHQDNGVWPLSLYVNPSLYGDNNTHLFINWTVDGFQKTGCYDNFCPGFVQVSTEIPLGGIVSPLSVYNGPQYAIRLLVFKDPTSGDWWMAFGKDQQVVGYWPKSLFSTLNDHATKVYFGGLVRSPNDKTSPPMGSGHFAKEGLRSACYSADLGLVNGSNVYTRIHEDQIEFYNSGPGCYDTGYLMNMQQGAQGFLFGGPGGCAYMI